VAREFSATWARWFDLRAERRFPPALSEEQQAELKAAIQQPPEKAGLALANWNWKVVREFVRQRFGLGLCRSTCLNYLHRLGFVLKRPKKRLVKASAEQRAAFVAQYAELRAEAAVQGAKMFFVDEAHFRADADLRGKWVLRGEPALVDSTSPRLGEKATYYSAVCLETGEVEVMLVNGNCTAETSVTFLRQLRDKHPQPLFIIWDNGPAHRGEAMRTYLTTPNLQLRLIALPAYSPDFNADEAIWDWAREEVTANRCLGTTAKVHEKVSQFFTRLSERADEVKQRCRTILQAQVEVLSDERVQLFPQANHVEFTLALV
jgi:transposase